MIFICFRRFTDLQVYTIKLKYRLTMYKHTLINKVIVILGAIALVVFIAWVNYFIQGMEIHFSMYPAPAVVGIIIGVLALKYFKAHHDLKDANQALQQQNQALEGAIKTKEQELQTQGNAIHQAQQSEALGRLAGGIAHDFNNLLTAIIGNAYLIAEDAKNPSNRQSANEIIRYSDQATQLTSQMLTISQKNVISLQKIDVVILLSETIQTLNRLLGENHTLELHQVDTKLIAMIDKVQLRQAIINLIINAKEAMPWGGRIEIATKKITNAENISCAEIDIIDHGIGITSELQDKIFEPFFSTKQGDEGTGLGLAVVKGVIDKHGGQIVCQSSENKGSTFKIIIPLTDTKDDTQKAAQPDNLKLPLSTEMKILIIEDETPVRTLLKKLLSQIGCQVVAIADSTQLDKIERAGNFDLLITDVVLPGASGPELAKFLLKKGIVPRVLFISGYPGRHHQLLQDNVQEDNFLPKPFTPEKFFEALSQYCVVSKK